MATCEHEYRKGGTNIDYQSRCQIELREKSISMWSSTQSWKPWTQDCTPLRALTGLTDTTLRGGFRPRCAESRNYCEGTQSNWVPVRRARFGTRPKLMSTKISYVLPVFRKIARFVGLKPNFCSQRWILGIDWNTGALESDDRVLDEVNIDHRIESF